MSLNLLDETPLHTSLIHRLFFPVSLNTGTQTKNLSLKAQDIVSRHPHKYFLLLLLVVLENLMILTLP